MDTTRLAVLILAIVVTLITLFIGVGLRDLMTKIRYRLKRKPDDEDCETAVVKLEKGKKQNVKKR